MANNLEQGIPFADYLALQCFHQSGLQYMKVSALNYYWFKVLKNEKKDTEAMRFGRLVHKAILEPEDFNKNKAMAPEGDRRFKAAKDAYAEFVASITPQSIVVERGDADRLLHMFNSLKRHKRAAQLFHKGIFEVTGIFEHPEFEEQCKVRLDSVSEDEILTDLKTTSCTSLREFESHAYKMGYNFQAAFYVDAYKAITGRAPKAFCIAAVQSMPPYDTILFTGDAKFIETGRAEYRAAFAKVLACTAANHWPGLADGFVNLSVPAWVGSDYMGEEEPQLEQSEVRSE